MATMRDFIANKKRIEKKYGKLTRKQEKLLWENLNRGPLYKKDKEGFWYADMTAPFRVSSCCKAAVTFSDDVLCCKNCWKEVPLALAADPVL